MVSCLSRTLPIFSNTQQFLIQNHYCSSSSSSSSISFSRKPNRTKSFVCLSSIGVQEIAEITHNKVLVASILSALIGEFSKPFTSVLLYNDEFKFEFKEFFRSGGFPSTHSSCVVAAATMLGLERGFSDSVFGVAVVFAAIVMYDAQGVRREVGKHAKVLNKISEKQKCSTSYRSKDGLIMESNSKPSTSSSPIDSKSPVPSLSVSENISTRTNPLTLRTEKVNNKFNSISSSLTENDNEVSDEPNPSNSSSKLKETVGHTEIEVAAGAFLGFLVSLAVYTTL
ncbi:hypothetical protein MKW94_013898 [Papaver nudicaule]|uniref:Acid phosphatase/vanadium-dependent haloperoxidase-related protein n=1 Tax=Papaver nudicaule TaxID=74823 RepID=A0AA41S5D7_PAPNU|nr:hypothetical protein [Papaver nudicaule]